MAARAGAPQRVVSGQHHPLRSRRAACVACAARPPPGGVYSEPRLYDAAFCRYSHRDFGAESAFLLRCAARHAGTAAAQPLAFLDLACGPGRHTHAAVAHPRCAAALGVDLSAAMCAYAAALAPGSAARFTQGDITALSAVPEVMSRPGGWDAVALLFSSLTHLVDDGAAAACLRGVARALSPRGVLCLELEHPRALFDGSLRVGDGRDDWCVPDDWDAFTEDGLSLRVRWGAPGDAWDPVRQTLRRTVALDVYERGEPLPRRAADETIATRFFGAPELQLLAAAAGLRVLATHGAMRDDVALQDPAATRLVMLLCRADADDDARATT